MFNPPLYIGTSSLQPSYQPLFQDLILPGNFQFPAQRVTDGTVEDDYFITNINESEAIISLTQADEFIRNEVEAGRIHGQGTYIDGCWEDRFGAFRFNLHSQWSQCGCYRLNPYGDFAPLEGQPCIETRNFIGALSIINTSPAWNTLWQFLRMATGVVPDPGACELGGQLNMSIQMQLLW